MNFTVYKITNNINNKCYIGSSINVKQRWQQEKNAAYNSKQISYNYPLSQAFRKYGIENFSFEILEIIDTDDWSIVNKKESEWIKNKNCVSPNGYNLKAEGISNQGGNKSTIPEDIQNKIIQDLKDGKFIIDIANDYQLSRSYVSDINNGRCLRKENETYPLQQNRMTNDEYYQIFDLLKNTNYSMNKIAEYLGRNRDTINKINNGYQQIVRALYKGDFPIRKNARFGYTLKPVETISGETESRVIIDT